MRNTRFKFLFILCLVLTIGLTSAFAAGNDKKKKRKKIPKNTGALSVKTLSGARTVKVDGQVVGQSGVTEAAEFYLTPGTHLVEIEGPGGQVYRKEVNIVKNRRLCICINFVEKTTETPCPYDMRVRGPSKVIEGDRVEFVATNVAQVTPIAATALNYIWTVTPDTARIVSGLGTNSITVDTTGLGNQTISVNLAVGDGVNDATCRQRIAVSTEVGKIEVEKPRLFDEFPTMSNDDDKARLDNLAIELQNDPNKQGYIIMYQGQDKKSKVRNANKLSKMALDYLVKERGVDPARLQIVVRSIRPVTTYQMWLVPPGATTPVPN